MSCAPFLSVTPRTLPWALLPPQSRLGSGCACGARALVAKSCGALQGCFLWLRGESGGLVWCSEVYHSCWEEGERKLGTFLIEG